MECRADKELISPTWCRDLDRGGGGGKQKRTDANLGLVYRSLNVGGDALFGGSIFYDRNLDQDNQRLGLSFDVQSQLGYASFNYYYPLSNDWQQGRSGFEERVRRGYDFRLEKLFYQGRIDVDLNLGAWRRNQPSKWVYTYGIDLGYKVTNYLSLNLSYEDFSGRPLSGLPSNHRWQLGLKLDLMKLYAPKPAQNAGNQSPLDLWRTVTREKRILYQERVAGTIIGFATSNYNVLGRGRDTMVELTIKASAPLSKDVALSYSTRDGTAEAGSDYEAKNGSLTIKAGATSATIQIKIIANTVGEPAEQFSVDLSLSTATAGVRVNPATLTITIDAALAPRVFSIERLTPASSNGTTNSHTVSWLITFSKLVENVDESDFDLNAGSSSIGATASSVSLQSNGTAAQNIDLSNFALNAGGSSSGTEILNMTLRNNDTEVVVTAHSNNDGPFILSFHSLHDIADEDDNRLLDTIPTSGINEDRFIIESTPVITLNGLATVSLEVGSSYTELGATASDNVDGDISGNIVISGSVDASTVGIYSVSYNVSDSAGNDADEVTRTVIVTADVTKPVITLTGPASISFEVGGSYTEAGATANDNIDGQINSRIVIDSTNVDANAVGTYSVTYNVSDIAGNDAAEVTRAVIVTADVTKPVITLTGSASISFEVGGSYTEAGATANDNIDGQINSRIVIDSTKVDANAVGTYSVTYNVSDIAGNNADTVTRAVIVTADVTKPVITLLGEATVSFEVGGSYTEAGATASDNIDGPIDSSRIVIDSTSVDANTVGTYSVTYNVSDNARNAADEVTREVIVTADVTKPVITLLGEATVSFEVGGSYTEAGATANDNIDGPIDSSRIVIDSTSVDANTVGTYSVTYNVSDIAGNNADTVTRAVIVTADVTKPVITLLGEATVSFEVGGSYTEAGATASDNIDGPIDSSRIVIDSTSVDANTVGTYSVTYNVSDNARNAADEVTREVIVTADVTKPVITLLGEATVSFEVGGSYTEAGATASDNIDGPIDSSRIVIDSTSVDANTVGTYSVTYNVSDNARNAADEVTREVIVTADVTKPVITLLGEATVSFEVGGSYTEAGATANDNIDGQINSRIVIDSTNVDANATGTYSVTYNVSDNARNAADEVTRAVIVSSDVTKPVITLTGPVSVSFEVGGSYTEAGATANDNIDGPIDSSRIVIDSTSVDANTVGTYSVTYNVSDNARNAADEVTREVIVTADVTKPVITLTGPASISFEVGGSYTEAGATAHDNIDGQINSRIVIDSTNVDANAVGTYSITYNVSDNARNAAAEVTREVIVTADVTKPVITLTGPASISFEVGGSYTEAGATAQDNIDGQINSRIVIDSTSVDANATGTYSVTYNVSDIAGNDADEVTRAVIVSSDVTKPVITLTGSASISFEVGGSYTEAGATANDNIDGQINNRIVIGGDRVDVNTVDTYRVTYNVNDAAGNAADTVTRTVNVTADVTKPVITLNGLATVSLEVGYSYTDAGATAQDNIDGQINNRIVIGGDSVDVNTVDTYRVTYNVNDAAGNAADTVTRTVNVTADVTKPVITLNGLATVSLEVGYPYSDAGATATDNIDGDVSANIVIDGDTVDANTVSIYSLTYNVVDDAGNAADEVIRTVKVTADVTKPVITLLGEASVNLEVGYLYSEDGATATDNIDGEITTDIVINSTHVDANTIGTYSVTYNVVDDAGNAADEVIRTVKVTADVTKPVITLNGLATVSLEVGYPYSDAGATATDNIDGDVSANIVIDGDTVDANTVSIYSLTYNVVDDAGNAADEVIRTVKVTADVTKPVITLLGEASVNLEVGYLYSEDGATASDNIDGEITNDIVINSTSVDANTVGTYSVTYNVVDDAGNAADEVIRTVKVTADVTKPVITLLGEASVNLEVGYLYSEDGATATDNIDGEITNDIVINSTSVDANTIGTYSVTYNVVDDAGNAADEVIRTVKVTADVTKPVITLLGEASVNLEVGYLYSEDGATASDNIDGEITIDIVINSTHVDANTVGTYSVTYNVVDDAGNAADEVIRTVKVTADVTKPVITLNGPATVSLELGRSYTDEGATATDNIDGDITGAITTTNPVDTNIAATYTITYNVLDAALNGAEPVTREVIVTADVTKPVITLNGPATVSLERGNTYTELGATAEDNIDGPIDSSRIEIDSTNVDTNTVGTYTVTYNVIDAALNPAEPVTREVIVTADKTKPVITLLGEATVSFEVGGSYTEAGATANDNIDGPIDSSRIVIGGDTVDVNTVDTYRVTYNVRDAAGNAADTVTRTVNVTADVTDPVITLMGENNEFYIRINRYLEYRVSAQDNIDGDITVEIVVHRSSVMQSPYSSFPYVRIITYNVKDRAGNAADPVTRRVFTFFPD